MSPLPDSLLRRMRGSLATLSNNPAAVLCVVLALNSLTRPYSGLVHDARLYAAQVSVRIAPETFERDLYLLHGSQDSYTLFTVVVYPLAALLGVQLAFFVLYMASKALLFWGAMRFIQALVKDRLITLLTLLLISVSQVSLWGNEAFHVNESFLTPRLGACALVLLALERLLLEPVRGARLWQALLLLAGAFLLHPLMAMGGGLALVLWSLSRWLTPRLFVSFGLVVSAAAVAILVYEPLGNRLFGHMDEEWRAIILRQAFYFDLTLWRPGDWLRVMAASVVVLAGARYCSSNSARLVLAILATGVIGLLGSVIAPQTHYRLLIQGQPYRALWLLEFLAYPLAWQFIVRLWRLGTTEARCFSLSLVVSVTSGFGDGDWFLAAIPPALFAICVLFVRRFFAEEARPRWLWFSALSIFAATIVLQLFEGGQELLIQSYMQPAPMTVLSALANLLPRLPVLLLGCAVLGSIHFLLGSGWRLRSLMLGTWCCYPALLLFLTNSPKYAANFHRDYSQVLFVQSVLESRKGLHPNKTLTVYFPTDLETSWFKLHANSYYNWAQMSGCAFKRGTAIEGTHRATIVRNFELANTRQLPPDWQSARENFFRMTGRLTPPTKQDLFDMCQDEIVDFVVIQQNFDGLYIATDGKWHVYDCKQIRSARREQAR